MDNWHCQIIQSENDYGKLRRRRRQQSHSLQVRNSIHGSFPWARHRGEAVCLLSFRCIHDIVSSLAWIDLLTMTGTPL